MRKYIDPRTGKIYKDSQVRAIKGKFMPNGVHKSLLKDYVEDTPIEDNSIQVVVKEPSENSIKGIVKDSPEREIKKVKVEEKK